MTRLDIIEKEFARCFFGYSPEEVDAFLDELADELDPPLDSDFDDLDDSYESAEELFAALSTLRIQHEQLSRRIEKLSRRYEAIKAMQRLEEDTSTAITDNNVETAQETITTDSESEAIAKDSVDASPNQPDVSDE